MPSKIRYKCRKNDCPLPSIEGSSYCAEHREEKEKKDSVRRAAWKSGQLLMSPDARESNRFYHSKQWQLVRAMQLHKQPLCAVCRAPARVVDHIKPILEGGARVAPENLQSLCTHCHDRKSQSEVKSVKPFE